MVKIPSCGLTPRQLSLSRTQHVLPSARAIRTARCPQLRHARRLFHHLLLLLLQPVMGMSFPILPSAKAHTSFQTQLRGASPLTLRHREGLHLFLHSDGSCYIRLVFL